MRIAVLLLTTLWLACTTTPATTTTTPPRPVVVPPAPVREPAVSEPSTPGPARTGDRLTLARTGCYGPCPVYELTVYPDGRVTWRGELYVSRTGTVHATIAAAAAAELIAAAARLDLAHVPHDPANATRARHDAATRTQ